MEEVEEAARLRLGAGIPRACPIADRLLKELLESDLFGVGLKLQAGRAPCLFGEQGILSSLSFGGFFGQVFMPEWLDLAVLELPEYRFEMLAVVEVGRLGPLLADGRRSWSGFGGSLL